MLYPPFSFFIDFIFCFFKIKPEKIFFQLVGQGLDTNATNLGITVGLDFFQLFEIAADKYLEEGNIGRARWYLFFFF